MNNSPRLAISNSLVHGNFTTCKHFVTVRSPLGISPALLMRQDRKQHDITLLRPFVFFLRAMPFSLMKPWHKLLLYFRTTWQLNMAERQAKHITLPRILFPIRLQSVGHFHTGLDAAEPIGVYLLSTGNKEFNPEHFEGKQDLQTKVMVALFGLFAEVENGPKKKDQCSLFVTVPGAIIKRFVCA